MISPIEPLSQGAVVAPNLPPAIRTPRPPLPDFLQDAGQAPRIVVGPPLGRGVTLPPPGDLLLQDVAVSATGSSNANLRQAVDPRLSRETSVEAAQSLLRDRAAASDMSPARFAEAMPITAAHDLPSRNRSSSHAALTTSLVMRDDGGDRLTVDLHVARSAESAWEASMFDRAGASQRSGFAYADAPVAVTTLQFDPRAGQFVANDPHRALQIVAPAPSSAYRPQRRRLVFQATVSSLWAFAVVGLLFLVVR